MAYEKLNLQDGVKFTAAHVAHLEQGIEDMAGKDGDPGAPGKDGVSPVVSVSKSGTVTTLTITDASGTKTAKINDGEKGDPGEDGYTPVKGVDYFDGKDGQPGRDGQDGVDGKDGVSGVHVGSSAPTGSQTVWIDPDGEPTALVDSEAREQIAKLSEEMNEVVSVAGGSGSSIREETIALDGAMSVGSYYNINGPDTSATDYKHTNKIKLNATKSFELTAANLNGVTIHPQLRYVVAFDAAGNYLADHKMEKIAEASISVGRTITMDDAVDSVIITIYKADNYTNKTIKLLGQEGSGGNSDGYTVLKTEKLSSFTSELLPDDVRYGIYKGGVADFTDKRTICTRGYVNPFVKSIAVVSEDYNLAVVVYKNGAYVQTVAWVTNGTSYAFDHGTYQYKLYIRRADETYMNTYDDARKSVLLTMSSSDVLFAYNKMKAQMDSERENTRNALEYMMRRNYDLTYANAPAPNGLISYVGNNQIVHPKVLYFADKFGGHRYWMAYTPYPWAVDDYENPCIAYSDDGYEWTNINGNPLDDPAGNGYNSDTHLVYNAATGTMEVWYRYVGDYDAPPVAEIIYRQTSTDGVNWTAKQVVINNTSGDYVQYLSPAVIYDGSKYKMWVVNGTDRALHYYESTDLSSFNEIRTIDLDYVDGEDEYRLWHIDVIEDNGQTVLLGMGKTSESTTLNQRWTLFLATSEDNATFTTPAVVMRGNPYGWDKQIYRSTIVNVNGEYRIYYSAQDETQKHGFGLSTSHKLSEFVGKIY